MGVNLWGESPPYENQGHPAISDANKSRSRRQGRFREEWSGGSRMARRASRRTETASPARGYPRLSLWVSGYDITKPDGSGGRVNAAVVHGQFTFPGSESGTGLIRGDLPDMRQVGMMSAIIWNPESALRGNNEGEQTEVSRGHHPKSTTNSLPTGSPVPSNRFGAILPPLFGYQKRFVSSHSSKVTLSMLLLGLFCAHLSLHSAFWGK
jgi:hypothetical protein